MEAAPSTPRPTATPASRRSRARGDAGAEPGVGRRAVRDRGAGGGQLRDRRVGQVHRVGQPDVRAQPAERFHVLHRRAAELLPAELLLVQRLAQVGVHPHALAPGQFRGLPSRSPVTENGEQGATPIRSIESNDGSWWVSIAASVAARMASMSSTTLSGGSPPLLCPRSIDPRVGWNRSPTRAAASISAVQHVAAVMREDVVVVGGGGAAGAGEPGQATGGRDVHQVGVDPPPHRVQRGQPAEQGVVHGQPAGDPLVQVVVGVDEPGGDQAAGRVDIAGVGQIARRRRRRPPR